MGDGRYYTTEQFFSIVILTLLIVISVISLMMCVYKWQQNKNSYAIKAAYILLITSTLFSFTEMIIRALDKIITYHLLSQYTFAGINLLITIFVLYMYPNLSKPLIATLFTFFFVPLFIYLIIYNSPAINNHLAFFIVLFLHLIGLNIITYIHTPYRINTSLFNDVKDIILDYVLITDDKGHLIYQNKQAQDSPLFSSINTVNLNKIDCLFTEEIAMSMSYGKHFIKTTTGIYFQYTRKKIVQNKQCVGYILTFVDLTELVNQIDELKSKELETSKINEQLTRYQSIVYELEKEKEINTLLSEIAETQSKSMTELKDAIVTLHQNTNENFDENISRLITITKSDLLAIREAVTTYMHYYDQ